MTILGFYPSIWIYWVFHIALVIVYGIYVYCSKTPLDLTLLSYKLDS